MLGGNPMMLEHNGPPARIQRRSRPGSPRPNRRGARWRPLGAGSRPILGSLRIRPSR